jgi:hypothetical protein
MNDQRRRRDGVQRQREPSRYADVVRRSREALGHPVERAGRERLHQADDLGIRERAGTDAGIQDRSPRRPPGVGQGA